MEKRRTAIFALIGAAMLLNISYGLINNGFPIPLRDSQDPVYVIETEETYISVPALREGGFFRSAYNMTVDIIQEEKNGKESGYNIEGMATRNIVDSGIIKKIDGSYRLSYWLNETEDFVITGDMQRSRETGFMESGLVDSEKLTTSLSIQGPKGMGSESDIESTIAGGPSIRSDNIWKMIVLGNANLNSSSSGMVEMDLDLQEIGSSVEDLSLEWSVVDIRDEIDGQRAIVDASSTSWKRGSISLETVFLDKCPWPEEMTITVSADFNTDEGPVRMKMIMTERITEWSPGEGVEVNFGRFEPLGPPYSVPVSDPVDIVPDEGGETLFRGDPRECLSTCIKEGDLLNSLADSYGWDELTFTDISYGKNDTMDPVWAWNITVAAPPIDGISHAVEFRVKVEGGGILDRKRLSLVSESRKKIAGYPDPDRNLITLADGEEELGSSLYSDSIFRGDTYSSTYRLDMIGRGNTCSDTVSIVFMNVLGIDRAAIRDLHISRVTDRSDPSTMYLVVIDGGQGGIVSETELRGAGISMLNAYGFDLA